MASFPNEITFIKGHINILTSLPITYPDSFQQPLEEYSKKVAIFPVELPPPPERKSSSSDLVPDTLSVVFKSTKPAISFPLNVSPSDTISTIKQQLASQPRAPPADIQRLLLKGKALADNKLLKEYGVTEGVIINLMIKPGSHWDGSGLSQTIIAKDSTSSIPSVVISASDSTKTSPVPLDLGAASFPPVPQSTPENSSFHHIISSSNFWDRLHAFLQSEFTNKDDVATAFEQFFLASKANLTVGEVARIRDQVGIISMGGT
ncbi:hypothetical protein Clacol_009229 [Clathrus columnatus]|uniref:Ubiquitin-like domain-containing protein n=1 Tax=Clathrus columnatus TaxID=1419009 RepID=A0AAV5AP72_9AGAM|nr:hypothetical protein Clacol_009229 [Clathrus columnatus]